MGELIRNRDDEEAFVIEPVLEIDSMEDSAEAKVEKQLQNTLTMIHHNRGRQSYDSANLDEKHLTIHIDMEGT